MNISDIKVSNKTHINFKASVSPQVKYQLGKQLSKYTGINYKRTAKALEEQIANVSRWGSKDSEIVIARDNRGQYRLGLQRNITPDMQYAVAIKGPAGKTELSQFLALKEFHILNAEDSIKYFYSKFGSGFFNRFK